jgi:DNA mismatch repair protein MutL
MAEIHVLDESTVNQIAAGEVIERPASVAKELLENAIDAKATAVTVEIREGGIGMIRITDNGCGIDRGEVRKAFLSHATSKIRSAADLIGVSSLGFRGEALASIAAVARVELITRTPDSIVGTRYVIEGGKEAAFEEIGAPEGTTFIVRDLFFNTPARRKFLHTVSAEGSRVASLVEKIALSHPEISFRFIQNGQSRLHTSGNHNLRDIIYTVYGGEIAKNLIPVDGGTDALRISGFIGKPVIARGSRQFEVYFINGRYIRNPILCRAIEEAYKPYMMVHKYPFTMLSIEIDPAFIDVNVHPSKMELRFRDEELTYRSIYHLLSMELSGRELIPDAGEEQETETLEAQPAPSGGEVPAAGRASSAPGGIPAAVNPQPAEEKIPAENGAPASRPAFEGALLRKVHFRPEASTSGRLEEPRGEFSPAPHTPGLEPPEAGWKPQEPEKKPIEASLRPQEPEKAQPEPEQKSLSSEQEPLRQQPAAAQIPPQAGAPRQMDLFEDKLLTPASRKRHRLVGQVFNTYWIVEFDNAMYIIDQHAAHEKVLYERTMATLKNRTVTTQQVNPPIVLSLTPEEQEMLTRYEKDFQDLGFEIDPFGGREYAVRGVPDNLFSIAKKDLLLEMLDSVTRESGMRPAESLRHHIATMSCKAAVKGNNRISREEADALIDELLTLENPYNCPHGRPTIIRMTRSELEKKFKRIV